MLASSVGSSVVVPISCSPVVTWHSGKGGWKLGGVGRISLSIADESIALSFLCNLCRMSGVLEVEGGCS